MSQFPQENKPVKLNLDKSRKALGPDEGWYLLNHDTTTGPIGKAVPMAANYPACEMNRPGGENYAIGRFNSPLTKECYSWIYNSNNVHYIQRINSDGVCQIVYHGCLPLSAFPKHAITQWRAYMKIDKLCANVHGKQLIWTFGEGPMYQLDVEAAIATNFFTTPFFDRCADYCDLIKMCVPDPCGCLHAEFIPLAPEDRGKTNYLVDTGIMLSYQFVYYDGRESIWADPSTVYYQNSKGCFDNSEGFSRCLKVRIPIGNPLVDKIRFAFWKKGAWYLGDTIDKYKKYTSAQQYWYERDLSETIIGNNFSEDDCSFDYTFCNDKQCDAIDPNEFNRVFNPIPRDVQALVPVGFNEQEQPALGAVNYKQGNCPIDKTEIEKFDINQECTDVKDCQPEMVNLTVRAVIHNFEHDRNQFIYRNGGSASNSADDPADIAYFGGLNKVLHGGFETGYDQQFNDKTRNFIAYIDGMPIYGEMKQWKAHAGFNQLELWGTIGNMSDVGTRDRWRRATNNGEFFYQELKLKVQKGTRGFLRLTSHHSTGNDQSKSTFVEGTINNIRNYRGDIGKASLDSILTYSKFEIYFDTCGGDVDIAETFLIQDNAVDDSVATKASAVNGYITDNNGSPVEGAEISDGGQIRAITDHNGFYHFYIFPGNTGGQDFDILVEKDCFEFKNVQTMSVAVQAGFNAQTNVKITDATWTEGFYSNVLVQVNDCKGYPVSGIRVSLSGSKFADSGADGIARWRIRNYPDRNRALKAVVLNDKGCLAMDCANECSPCMPTVSGSTADCFFTKPTTTLAAVAVNIVNTFDKGLKKGGRYPFGFYVRFGCNKISAVYEVKYIDIPRLQESLQSGFCPFRFNANGMVLPDDAVCLEIVRGVNINPFELQWVVDKVERTDDGKIKLTIQSLNDYNARYFFKTNTGYQWLAGDRVEFIRNGDGSIFDIGTHGLLNYLTVSPFHDEVISGLTDAPDNYFNQLIIEDDGKLDGLTAGAVIEIQRSKECTTSPTYFSICASIPVIDGRLAYESGLFTTFDTYFVNRVITNNIAGAQTSSGIQRFEHFSPSDFWGTFGTDGTERLSDIGRAYFVNKFENEKRFGRNISFNAPNIFNRFGDLVKTFKQSLHGDIIAIGLRDDKIGMCISEYNNSLFQAGNDLLQVTADGLVHALSAAQVISDPQAKYYGDYGCKYESIGSIYFGDGFVKWNDVNKGCDIVHNYQYAKPADDDRMVTYFRKRSQEIESWNKGQTDPLNHLRFCIGYNVDAKNILLTIKTLRDSGVNNEPGPYKKRNETIVYSAERNEYLTFHSVTPEDYGELDLLTEGGCAFIAFYNGVPYIHPKIPTRYNEFFGIACDWFIGISINVGPKKIKMAVAMEQQSDETFFIVKEVVTDKPNYRSEIPASRFKKDGRKWNAGFLANINSRSGLYGDERPTGYYISCLLCRDNTQALAYNTIDNNKRTAYSELDTVISKVAVHEQSGFEVNV
jgi:hypothetical protein